MRQVKSLIVNDCLTEQKCQSNLLLYVVMTGHL